MLIELKTVEAVGPVLDQIEARGLTGDVLLASFRKAALITAKRRSPYVKTCLLFRHPIGFWFRQREQEMWARVETTHCDYVGPRANVVTHELVTRAHALGRQVYAYHVHSARRAQRLMGMGVDALGMDNPERVAAIEPAEGHVTPPPEKQPQEKPAWI